METKKLDNGDRLLVCEGSFTVTAHSVEDQAAGGGDAVLLEIVASGFQATPRGFGFAMGTLMRWYLDKVSQYLPQDDTRVDYIAGIMVEMQSGIGQAIAAGETILPRQ